MRSTSGSAVTGLEVKLSAVSTASKQRKESIETSVVFAC